MNTKPTNYSSKIARNEVLKKFEEKKTYLENLWKERQQIQRTTAQVQNHKKKKKILM